MMTQSSNGLTAEEQGALETIAYAAQVWCPLRKLQRAGHSSATLGALQARGWIEPWDVDRRGKPLSYPSWALTPFAARQLGLYVVEARGCPVWSGAAEGRRELARGRMARRERRLAFPELVPDRKQPGGRCAQYIASRYWNEVTDDPEKAERILGAPVRLVATF